MFNPIESFVSSVLKSDEDFDMGRYGHVTQSKKGSGKIIYMDGRKIDAGKGQVPVAIVANNTVYLLDSWGFRWLETFNMPEHARLFRDYVYCLNAELYIEVLESCVARQNRVRDNEDNRESEALAFCDSLRQVHAVTCYISKHCADFDDDFEIPRICSRDTAMRILCGLTNKNTVLAKAMLNPRFVKTCHKTLRAIMADAGRN